MALPHTSRIASCSLVHGVIFSCRASTKTQHAAGLVHRQLCHYHACTRAAVQHLGVMMQGLSINMSARGYDFLGGVQAS